MPTKPVRLSREQPSLNPIASGGNLYVGVQVGAMSLMQSHVHLPAPAGNLAMGGWRFRG